MQCFVIMPFGDPARDPAAAQLERVYEDWIKPAVEDVRLPGNLAGPVGCHRSDREERPGEIISHVVEHLTEADVVIADLTGRNPNVFYELGVRHAVSNGTILIAQSLDDIPFDLRPLRHILYSYEPESMLQLRRRLQAAIVEVAASVDRIDNPVRRFLADRDARRILADRASPESDTVRSLQAELQRLSTDFQRHAEEIRALVEAATIQRSQPTEDVWLRRFDGVWTALEHGGAYCARTIDGELHVAYAFNREAELTGHLFNCRLVGQTVFARFSWFRLGINGFIFLKPNDPDQITGWWWHSEDVPSSVLNDLERAWRDDGVSQNLLTGLGRTDVMQPITLVRKADQRIPRWAEQYFAKRQWESAGGLPPTRSGATRPRDE